MNSNVAIVIPAYNEAKTIGRVIETVSQFGAVYVVSDGSTDDTAGVAKLKGANVIVNQRNLGYDGTIDHGFKVAALDPNIQFFITMDADGQHDPSVIPQFIAQWSQGNELVLGVRPAPARFGERVFAHYGQLRW